MRHLLLLLVLPRRGLLAHPSNYFNPPRSSCTLPDHNTTIMGVVPTEDVETSIICSPSGSGMMCDITFAAESEALVFVNGTGVEIGVGGLQCGDDGNGHDHDHGHRRLKESCAVLACSSMAAATVKARMLAAAGNPSRAIPARS